MKISVIVLLLLLPAAALAQNYQNYEGMNEQDMQKMMQQMQKMQTCMEDVDQEKLNQLEQRSQQIDAELKALCAEGKRDEAQAKAISFGKEFENDPTLQTMRKCSAMMEGMVPEMPYMETVEDKDYSGDHVCD